MYSKWGATYRRDVWRRKPWLDTSALLGERTIARDYMLVPQALARTVALLLLLLLLRKQVGGHTEEPVASLLIAMDAMEEAILEIEEKLGAARTRRTKGIICCTGYNT